MFDVFTRARGGYCTRMRTLVLGACLLSFCALATEASFPVAEGYGFDWLAPDSATCTRIAAADTKQFRACEFHTSGAFGLDLAYHSCPRASKRGEVLVFESQAACQEALETMQANAP